MKCKKCGVENEKGSFCLNCGEKLEKEENIVDESEILSIEEPKSTSMEDENKMISKEMMKEQVKKDSKKSSKKKKMIVIIAIAVLLVLILGYFLFEYFCPRISVINMKERYEYQDFIKKEYKIKSSLFVSSKNTIWNINGYDFYKGTKPSSIPIKSGENKLLVTNGKVSKTYTFTITMTNSLLLTDERIVIDPEYLDYDGDGIPNGKEVELGLSTYTNDTDGDELYDNVELIMGLDPKVKDNYDEIRSYDVIQDNKKDTSIYVTIKGKGNIANNFLDTTELNVGYSRKFVVSDVVKLVTSETEKTEEKTIYFKKKHGWKLDDYSIYDYNEKTSELKELQTKENKDYLYTNIELDHLLFIGKKSEAPNGVFKNQIMILLDNSGSMYSKDYVAEKLGRDLSKQDDSEYGNDIEYKRLSLMTSLVDRLGTEKYEYSVHAFTGDYCDLIVNSKNTEAIKTKIDSLKTDCQNFNGTELSESIRKYAKTFDLETPGEKYMLVLTDGVDAGLFAYELYNFELSNIKEKGIKIITIGLGKGVNSEYLQKIAAATNGTYLYASDANMLETLISIIENSIKDQKTTTIDDKEVSLLADSGFDVTRDGFSFKNFSSQDAPGNCYGFSMLTKSIYLNKLPISAPYVESSLESNSELIEYTLTDLNKERLTKGKVYGIKLDSDYQFFLYMSELPDNYLYLGEDGIPYITQEYKDKLIPLGFKPLIIEREVELTIDGKTATYSKYESSGDLDLVNSSVDDKYKDDYQVLQLINRNYRIQAHHTLDRAKDNIAKLAQGKTYDYKKEVDKMIIELKTGSPSLLSLNSSNGRHSVLATKVYKSNDLEEYIIGIYDSNTPGEEGKAYLKRQTMYYPFSETSYYDFHYKGGSIEFIKMIYAGEY